MPPSAALCCDSIELKRFESRSIPDTGSCYTLRKIWLWNYQISSCSVTTQTSNALLLTCELKYTIPSQNSPVHYSDSSLCGDCIQVQTHNAHAKFYILLLWQVQRDEGVFPPPSGYSVVSFQCFSVLLISKISLSAAIWNSLSVPLHPNNFPVFSWQNIASLADVS